ncbi:hypothetical protein G7061_01935 [Erysipelothrix sp. HDW6B]|uniref:hypothetical protein n=1 Tax=Erysipelothrix sp. HDW6B TaxID=2714929 RepID=UPI00140AF366|nr:hypothetical protein [Erysipelothrix sp. HDW6B]QIK85452.1 hypothetical protein G7061_01935 [Erysipelothrix sp. HDW6B]
MISEQIIDKNVEQGFASYVDYLNNIRLTDLMNTLESILTSETDKLSDLATKSANALSNLDWAKAEIDNLININRGGDTGVHGFISEFAETGIRNARDVFQGLQKSVVLLNDNGPADILLQGKEMQMKFYANIQSEIKQASNYDKMIMIFPKDHVEVIEEIMSGAKSVEINGNILSNSQVNNIRKAIEDESALRGVPHYEWLKSSVLKYEDVQKGRINKTLSGEATNINKQTAQQKTDIKKEADSDRLKAKQKAEPSFGEASKVAGIGAMVQGGFNLGIFVYQKHKQGKEVWDFDIEDWKECGLSTAKGTIKGGVSGYAIYGLTNICHLSAPSAGAITSGTFGLSNAIIKYRNGDVDTDGFIDLVVLNAIDATGAAIGAAIGQTVIPIPVAGALVGSIVATIALSLGKGVLNKHEIEVINIYQERINAFVDKLDKEYQVKLDELLNKYHKLGELQQFSFDFNINVQLRFVSSINIAKYVRVPEISILKNEDEIDKYFLC